MGLVDQIKEVLDLLKFAAEDISEWVEELETDNNYSREAVEDSKELVSKIESLLHDIGA